MSRIPLKRELAKTRSYERVERLGGTLMLVLGSISGSTATTELMSGNPNAGKAVEVTILLGALAVQGLSMARSASLTAAAQEGVLAHDQLNLPVEAERMFASGQAIQNDPLN